MDGEGGVSREAGEKSEEWRSCLVTRCFQEVRPVAHGAYSNFSVIANFLCFSRAFQLRVSIINGTIVKKDVVHYSLCFYYFITKTKYETQLRTFLFTIALPRRHGGLKQKCA